MEGDIKNFYDLKVWQTGHELALAIYKITKDFPRDELYGVTSQLRRAASSITANIAEGFARYHFNDKVKFYYYSRGSAAEVLNFLLLAKDLGYIDIQILEKIKIDVQNITQLINGLIIPSLTNPFPPEGVFDILKSYEKTYFISPAHAFRAHRS